VFNVYFAIFASSVSTSEDYTSGRYGNQRRFVFAATNSAAARRVLTPRRPDRSRINMDVAEFPDPRSRDFGAPGNSQPRDRHCRHHARNTSSSCGENIE
jgi:hypothetical protein